MNQKLSKAYDLLNAVLVDAYVRTTEYSHYVTTNSDYWALTDDDDSQVAILDNDDVSVIEDMATEWAMGNPRINPEILSLYREIKQAPIITTFE